MKLCSRCRTNSRVPYSSYCRPCKNLLQEDWRLTIMGRAATNRTKIKPRAVRQWADSLATWVENNENH